MAVTYIKKSYKKIPPLNKKDRPPPVTLNINDTLVIHLVNNLNEPTTVHAHGINQDNGTNHMDGAGMVTQW